MSPVVALFSRGNQKSLFASRLDELDDCRKYKRSAIGQSEVQSSTLFADSIKTDISLLDSKIEKLMSAYLESALSLEEYRGAKNKLVNQNQLLKEKLSAFEQKANNRFELTEKFLKFNMELASDRTNEENAHLFKKVGSNFKIKDRTVLFEPRGAWKILSDSEFFGENAEQTALRADHIFGGNLNSEFWRWRFPQVRTGNRLKVLEFRTY